MFNEINIVDDYFNKSNVDYNKSNIERINDDEFVIEAKIKRVNDEGEDIPEKCNECGSKICLFLKGEPVWLCSNKKCGKYFGTLPCTIQEGAWQDIRNGVNPKSKKLFFHISMDSKMNGKTLKPRIPSYISEKGSKSDKYKEDETTPRVCFSPSIEGCLNAIISTQKNLDIVGKNIFVYVPEKGISEYKIKTNKELIKEKLVFDATTTGEMWILEPVKLKLYGVIVVDQVKNVHEKKTVDGIPHGRFDYKWHWAVTPKYVERTLDRQVTYDEWLKQAPKENNKTIKECVTMSNYPSRFTLDETIEDIIQEANMLPGFTYLRMRIAQALEGKFEVTNIFKVMTGKEKFDIKSVDNADTTTTSVELTNAGCNVVSWGPTGQPKYHFNNISLSMAFDKIIELFKRPELLLEGAIFSRFRTGVFMESDDNNEDEDLDETLKDIESSVDNDENDDVDIDSFGSDTSDQQNEYSEKDITILNHLIAGESEAINDYFDGAKDANNETLRRLYGDIGHEERFHLEQLLYAKSTLTGEKYEPRDPAVEEEYKSLLAMGMDEDTAASTAIDRLSMVGNDDGDDSDIEELEQESAIIETMLFQNEIITNICEQYSTKKIDSSVGVILEAFFQEDVFSTTNATSAERQIPNPISLLLKGIRASISGLSRMSGIIRESITKSNMKNNRKKEWIKKNGISNLFASGIELYLYSNDKIDTETPARYVDLLYRLTRQIAENSGLALTANAQHKTISNPIKFNSITDGLNIVKKTILTKTKVIVNDTNKDTLAREFFGYSEQKTNVPVKHGSSEKSVNDSNNVYNRMEVLILLTKQYCKISEEVLVQLEKKGAEPRAHEGLKLIVSKYNEFIKAIAHDLKVILKLDNGLLKLTHERDAAEQSGDKWKGPDIRVPEPNNKKTKAPHKW